MHVHVQSVPQCTHHTQMHMHTHVRLLVNKHMTIYMCVLSSLSLPLHTHKHTHTHTHTHTCTSIFVRTLIDIMHSLAPYPNLNHHNWVPNPNPNPNLNLNLILTITLKPSLNPQNVIWRCLKKWGPAKMSSLSQNVFTLFVKHFFWSLLYSKYKCKPFCSRVKLFLFKQKQLFYLHVQSHQTKTIILPRRLWDSDPLL